MDMNKTYFILHC